MSRNLSSSVSGINGVAVAASLAGLAFLVSAVKGSSLTATVRAWIAGSNPTGTALVSPVGTSVSIPAPLQGRTAEANRALGRAVATSYGWSTGAQWTALDNLFTRESGWNNTAENQSSGAYGIAQALPPTKYPFAGQKSGGSVALVQITWGYNYIKQRYGDPVTAWQHEIANNWY